MIVNVDVEAGTVSLEQPDSFTEFHVSAGGRDLDAVVGAVGGTASGRDDHVWIPIASVREWAGARAEDPGWRSGFEGMLDYARSKGWVDDDAGRVEAHVEWAAG